MTDTLQSDDIVVSVDETEDEQPIFTTDELLGKYISHHPINRLRLLIQVGVVYFVITTLLQVLFVNLDDQTASILLIFFFAGVALALGWLVMHLWNREVVVYEHGFNYREGSSIADFQYNEVASFRQKAERLRYFGGLIRRNAYTFTIRTHRDEVIKLTNLYSDIEKLGKNLEIGINSVLRERIRQALSQGESVSFGDDFELNQEGILANGHELAWNEFADLSSRKGYLILSSAKDKTWYEAPLHEVDNLTLLVEILQQKRPKIDKA